MIPGLLERDELIEQAYFFRTFRERLEANLAAQDVLLLLAEELLSTTRLPLAVQYLATEMKHSGSLGRGFARLPHYFTPFQSFVAVQAEDDKRKMTLSTALLVLEREAEYKAGGVSPAGLFMYMIETITRNRLGYEDGLTAMANEPAFNADWRLNASMVRKQIGMAEFAELVYLRSEWYVADRRRSDPEYVPPVPALFGEKEGKIAAASLGRDPLFLFAALQRQLGYPEVPKPKPRDDRETLVQQLQVKIREMDIRLRMLEAEARGTFDPLQFGKPEMFRDLPDDTDLPPVPTP